jgi:hypothetical protein
MPYFYDLISLNTWAPPLPGRLLTLVLTTAHIETDVGWGSADKRRRLMKHRVGFEDILGVDEERTGSLR